MHCLNILKNTKNAEDVIDTFKRCNVLVKMEENGPRAVFYRHKFDSMETNLDRECNGLVCDLETQTVLSYPPPPLAINKWVSSDKAWVIDVHDGTMFTLYYYDDNWCMSTNRAYDITNMYPFGYNYTYGEILDFILEQCYPTFSYDALNKTLSYSMCMCSQLLHPSNEQNKIYLVGVYTKDGKSMMLNATGERMFYLSNSDNANVSDDTNISDDANVSITSSVPSNVPNDLSEVSMFERQIALRKDTKNIFRCKHDCTKGKYGYIVFHNGQNIYVESYTMKMIRNSYYSNALIATLATERINNKRLFTVLANIRDEYSFGEPVTPITKIFPLFVSFYNSVYDEVIRVNNMLCMEIDEGSSIDTFLDLIVKSHTGCRDGVTLFTLMKKFENFISLYNYLNQFEKFHEELH